MTREIEFRGKLSHSGEWVFGNLLKIDGKYHIVTESDMCEDGHHIRQESDTPTWVDQDTVGQFTGMRDKNGRKIYDGDIVRRKDSAYGMEDTGVVKFCCSLGAFVLESENRGRTYRAVFKKGFSDNDGKCTVDGTYTYEVVGNIHEK